MPQNTKSEGYKTANESWMATNKLDFNKGSHD